MPEKHLVPNSFQHPNFLVDKLDYYLTAEESKVLSKAVREILGWRDKITERKAPIALSVFVDGKFSKDGERLCYGCGLGLQTVRNTLASLHEFGILLKVGQPTQDGQMYWLQDDESKIDWEALETRRAKWDEANAKRTQKATKKSLVSRGVTSDVRGNVGRKEGVTSDVSEGVTSDVSEGVTSDVNKETQLLETQIETQGGAAEKTPPAPAPSHDPTYLPTVEEQLPVLFPHGQEDPDYEQVIQRSGWRINNVEHRRAMALFLESSQLDIPFDKSARKDWLKQVNIHVKTYGLDRLREMYPRIVSEMRADGLSICRPGSLTNPLADMRARDKNGGNHATNRRTSPGTGLSGSRRRAEYKVADPSKFSTPGDP